jgi:hypothetical protein
MLHPTHLIPIMAAWHMSFTEISKHTSAPPISKNMNHLLHTLIWLLHYTHLQIHGVFVSNSGRSHHAGDLRRGNGFSAASDGGNVELQVDNKKNGSIM